MFRVILITLLMLLLTVLNVNASDGIPDNCENTQGAYYQPNLFARYDRNTQRLVLADWSTGAEVRVLAENLLPTRIINWSPDCRYLAVVSGEVEYAPEPEPDGSIRWVDWENFTISVNLFDAVTGVQVQQVGAWNNPLVMWSPRSDYALVSGHSIWNITTNQVIRLNRYYGGFYNLLRQVYWDYGRGWLWVGTHGVAAHDMNSGAEVFFFENIPLNPIRRTWLRPDTFFVFSADNSLVVTYGLRNFPLGSAPAITIWNIDTRTATRLNAAQFAQDSVQLSNDNRWLGTSGEQITRIWDLQNLSAVEDERLPIYYFPNMGTWRFENNQYVTTDGYTEQHYDLETGTLLP